MFEIIMKQWAVYVQPQIFYPLVVMSAVSECLQNYKVQHLASMSRMHRHM